MRFTVIKHEATESQAWKGHRVGCVTKVTGEEREAGGKGGAERQAGIRFCF